MKSKGSVRHFTIEFCAEAWEQTEAGLVPVDGSVPPEVRAAMLAGLHCAAQSLPVGPITISGDLTCGTS